MPTPKKRNSGGQNAENEPKTRAPLAPGHTRVQGTRQVFDHNGDPIDAPAPRPADDPDA